jgi:hypothetical protein
MKFTENDCIYGYGLLQEKYIDEKTAKRWIEQRMRDLSCTVLLSSGWVTLPASVCGKMHGVLPAM